MCLSLLSRILAIKSGFTKLNNPPCGVYKCFYMNRKKACSDFQSVYLNGLENKWKWRTKLLIHAHKTFSKWTITDCYYLWVRFLWWKRPSKWKDFVLFFVAFFNLQTRQNNAWLLCQNDPHQSSWSLLFGLIGLWWPPWGSKENWGCYM